MSDTNKKPADDIARDEDNDNETTGGFMKTAMLTFILGGISIIIAGSLWIFTSFIFDCSFYLECWFWIPLIIVLIIPFITVFFLKKQIADIVAICCCIISIVLCVILFYRRNKVEIVDATNKSGIDMKTQIESIIHPSGIALLAYNGSIPQVSPDHQQYLLQGSPGSSSSSAPSGGSSGSGGSAPGSGSSSTPPSGSSSAVPSSSASSSGSGHHHIGQGAQPSGGNSHTSLQVMVKGVKGVSVSPDGHLQADNMKALKNLRLSGYVRQGIILVEVGEPIGNLTGGGGSGRRSSASAPKGAAAASNPGTGDDTSKGDDDTAGNQ